MSVWPQLSKPLLSPRSWADAPYMRTQPALGFGCWLDDGSEMLHALKAFALALTTEIEDEFTDSQATVRSNVCDNLLCSAGERPTFEPSLTLCGQRDIVERGFIGDRERFRIASSHLGQALEVTQRNFQLMWSAIITE